MDSDDVRRQWAERSGEYSPRYYAHYGPNETSEAIRAVIDRYLDRSAAVLELGCSSGRHLAHLHEDGFENLAGIEVNEEAFDVMRETYPDLAADGTFYAGAIEDVVEEFDDDSFDAVFSVETLQHVHPDAEWVFAELARITGDLLVTAESEREDGSDGEPEDASESDPESEADDASAEDLAVNYVHGEVPLYYRDWRRRFTDLGLVEVDARRGKRNTVRTFRATEV